MARRRSRREQDTVLYIDKNSEYMRWEVRLREEGPVVAHVPWRWVFDDRDIVALATAERRRIQDRIVACLSVLPLSSAEEEVVCARFQLQSTTPLYVADPDEWEGDDDPGAPVDLGALESPPAHDTRPTIRRTPSQTRKIDL